MAEATILRSAICRTRVFPRPAPSLFTFPGLSSRPIYEWDSQSASDYAWKDVFSSYSMILSANYDTIRLEYEKIRRECGEKSDYNIGSDEHKLHHGGWDWNSYILKGKRQPDFAVRCPKTVEILESFQHPVQLMTQTPFSFGFFSTLKSGSKIDTHTGPCNLRIRCHFPLIVPEGDCGMEVGGVNVVWKEKKAVFFDDCYEHKVWNNTSKDRVVLLFDLWHPELKQIEIDAIIDMFGYAKTQGWLKS